MLYQFVPQDGVVSQRTFTSGLDKLKVLDEAAVRVKLCPLLVKAAATCCWW